MEEFKAPCGAKPQEVFLRLPAALAQRGQHRGTICLRAASTEEAVRWLEALGAAALLPSETPQLGVQDAQLEPGPAEQGEPDVKVTAQSDVEPSEKLPIQALKEI